MIFALVCNLLTVFVCVFFVASFGLFIVTLAMANKVIMNSFFSHMELTLWPLSVHCWLFFLAYFFFFLLSVVCVAFYLNANLNKAKDRVEIGNWNEDIFKTHVTFVVFSLFFVQRYKYFFGVFSTSSGRVFKCVCRVCFPHLLLKVALSVFWM